MTTGQKIELIEMSAEAGAKVIEIGSFVHPEAVPQMADTDEVAKRIKRKAVVEYRALIMNLILKASKSFDIADSFKSRNQ